MPFKTVLGRRVSGNLVKADKILAHLRYICQSSAETPVELQVGVLTSQNRDIWAKARQKLINLGNLSVTAYFFF